jgi:hypothetical protein
VRASVEVSTRRSDVVPRASGDRVEGTSLWRRSRRNVSGRPREGAAPTRFSGRVRDFMTCDAAARHPLSAHLAYHLAACRSKPPGRLTRDHNRHKWDRRSGSRSLLTGEVTAGQSFRSQAAPAGVISGQRGGSHTGRPVPTTEAWTQRALTVALLPQSRGSSIACSRSRTGASASPLWRDWLSTSRLWWGCT